VHRVIEEAGWLTWEEYCYLIVATSWREGGRLRVYDWAENPEQLARELCYLESVMRSYPTVKPYVPVLKKVIKRYLWDMEMRKKYPGAIGRRNREFEKSGLTLNFTELDLEREEKIRLDGIRKVGDEESKLGAAEKVVESENVPSEEPRSFTLTSDDPSNTSLLEKSNGDAPVTK
jgi:hypothetical protein